MQYKLYALIILPALFFLLAPGPGLAETGEGTEITSRDMTYTGPDNIVVFTGDVHVVRPDFELWSQELHVHLKPGAEGEDASGPGGDENIEKIIARKEVRIQGEGREGFCNLLTYYPDVEEVHMEEDPKLVEGRNTVEGELIILNLKENTSRVKGGDKKRVRVIFHPDEEE